MALPQFPTKDTDKAASDPFNKKPVTLDELKKAAEEKAISDKKAAEEKAARDRAMAQAEALDKVRSDAIVNAKTPLTRDVMLDELKDPEVELRAKEAREAMATDPGVKARAAAAAVPKSVDEYQKKIEEPRIPDPVKRYQDTIEAGRVRAQQAFQAPQGPDPAEKSPADSATEIANAPPDRVGEVIEKLKEEEKKGGPNFFDVIEAAAAGWNGKIPLYVQKELAKSEEQAAMDRLKTQAADEAEKQAKAYAEEERLQGIKGKQEENIFAQNAALQRELAGMKPIAPVASVGGLSLGEFMASGGK